ncbi:MAG: hypothetical protein JWN34_377 [Bryobacterales bacterium]|nr:hypothetical protein [Bryobacterales bacterium]
MPLFTAYLWNPRTRSKTELGRVRGKNSANAWLRAQKKYNVPAAQHRCLGVDLVVPPRPSLNLPPEEMAQLRQLSKAMNTAVRKSLKETQL